MIDINDSSFLIAIKKTTFVKAFMIVAIIIGFLGFTDLMIGSELSFSIFYLIPITVAVLLSGKQLGFLTSVICAIVWIVADIQSGLKYSDIFIPIWNTTVRFMYFIFHTFILAKLLDSINEIKLISFHDPLTKAANWRFFEEYSNKIIKTSVREKKKLTIAYLDVDNFKQINDTLGHGIGDEVLIKIASIIKNEIRPSDLLARLGGDEFAVIITDIGKNEATELLSRINKKVLEEMNGNKWNVTLSIGAMVFSTFPSTIGPMLKLVDDIMYEVKKSGKNNLEVKEQ